MGDLTSGTMAAVTAPGSCAKGVRACSPHSRRHVRGIRALVALLVASALVLSGCGGDDPSETPSVVPSSTDPVPTLPPSEPPEPEPYLPVPASVTLTNPGWALRLGEKATVAWKLPGSKKAKGGKAKPLIAVVDLKVTAIEAATLKDFAGWDLDKDARSSNPFFVRMAVKNVGRTNLSGAKMPLYIVDGTNTLIQMSTFDGDFKPCASTPLPAGFKPGSRTQLCLVYLAPNGGRLTSVSYRPMETFVPITWTGPITAYSGKKKSKKK